MNNLIGIWKKGLEKTSKSAFGQIATLLGFSEITPDIWEDLEAHLIQADIGVETTRKILQNLEKRTKQDGITKASDFKQALRQELRALLLDPPAFSPTHVPTVILIVGVNGSGKTTTIAKLGHYFKKQGKSVLLAAADTFRAAAVDQLEIWAERLNLPIVAGQPGGDAGAVAFDAIHAAIARQIDLVIIDTAGRLHTRYNLMEELKKVYRVCGKALENAPHVVWLVMDATTGQNALPQAQAFKNSVNINGVILAKLDSSARGGMVFAIQQQLGLPILFVGLGEKPEDLHPFNPDAFIGGILSEG